jgi:hypothetical protein
MDTDKVMKYRQAVQTLLSRYVAEDVVGEDIEVQLICDVERRSLSMDECRLGRLKTSISIYCLLCILIFVRIRFGYSKT